MNTARGGGEPRPHARPIRVVSAVLALGLAPLAVRTQQPGMPESASVAPGSATVGTPGTFTVRYVAGPAGLRTGAAIRVELPKLWHGGVRNSARGIHSTHPDRAEYVAARSSNPQAGLYCEVIGGYPGLLQKDHHVGLLGVEHRYQYVTEVTVTRGSLLPGDTLAVVYGDRSQGSPGYTSAYRAAEGEEILVASDPEGDGTFRLLPDRPALTTVADAAVEVVVTVPSVVRAG